MQRRTLWLIALGFMTMGKLCLFADENFPPIKQSSPVQCTGKIVVIDYAANTCTVEIQKRLYLFPLKSKTTVLKRGKQLSIKDLIAGQTITLMLVSEHEQLEVISI